jgi:alcohol dehydrogenase
VKAAQIMKYGHAEIIQLNDVNTPRPEKGQALIEVHASSINPVDWKVREGYMQKVFQLNFPATLGFDFAGVVRELGGGPAGLKIGDKVYGQAGSWSGGTGAFAEFAVASAAAVARMPDKLSFAEAAVLPLTGVSAVQAITEHINLRSGQKILIQGGSGGIGSIAIEIAKNLGAHVIATASSKGAEFVKSLGADEAIDYSARPFEDAVADCDAVFDTVGGETYARSFKVLKKGGIIVSMLAQPDTKLAAQYGVRAIAQFTQVTAARLNALRELVERGVVTAHIDSTYPLERIREAFEAKEKGKVLGKIAVQIRA